MKWKKGHLGVFQAEGAASSKVLKAGAKSVDCKDRRKASGGGAESWGQGWRGLYWVVPYRLYHGTLLSRQRMQ